MSIHACTSGLALCMCTETVCSQCLEHGLYYAIAVNSKGLLAVTDGANRCVHLLTNNGTLVMSIGEGVLGGDLFGVSFDLKGNVWVTDYISQQ